MAVLERACGGGGDESGRGIACGVSESGREFVNATACFGFCLCLAHGLVHGHGLLYLAGVLRRGRGLGLDPCRGHGGRGREGGHVREGGRGRPLGI